MRKGREGPKEVKKNAGLLINSKKKKKKKKSRESLVILRSQNHSQAYVVRERMAFGALLRHV